MKRTCNGCKAIEDKHLLLRYHQISDIECEIPPSRKTYEHGVGAVDKETAIKRFKANNPKAKIRKVSDWKND